MANQLQQDLVAKILELASGYDDFIALPAMAEATRIRFENSKALATEEQEELNRKFSNLNTVKNSLSAFVCSGD